MKTIDEIRAHHNEMKLHNPYMNAYSLSVADIDALFAHIDAQAAEITRLKLGLNALDQAVKDARAELASVTAERDALRKTTDWLRERGIDVEYTPDPSAPAPAPTDDEKMRDTLRMIERRMGSDAPAIVVDRAAGTAEKTTIGALTAQSPAPTAPWTTETGALLVIGYDDQVHIKVDGEWKSWCGVELTAYAPEGGEQHCAICQNKQALHEGIQQLHTPQPPVASTAASAAPAKLTKAAKRVKLTASNSVILRQAKKRFNAKIYKRAIEIANSDGEIATLEYLLTFVTDEGRKVLRQRLTWDDATEAHVEPRSHS